MNKLKEYIPYLIFDLLLLITDIVLLSLQMFYPALIFFISSFFAMVEPFIFFKHSNKNNRLKNEMIFLLFRMLYLVVVSAFICLLWYYIEVIKENVHPFYLIIFLLITIINYFVFIVSYYIRKRV